MANASKTKTAYNDINKSEAGSENALKYLAKFNEINKLKAELFINRLDSWVNEMGLTKKARQARANTAGIMFTANANIIAGFRALSNIEAIVRDSNNVNAVDRVLGGLIKKRKAFKKNGELTEAGTDAIDAYVNSMPTAVRAVMHKHAKKFSTERTVDGKPKKDKNGKTIVKPKSAWYHKYLEGTQYTVEHNDAIINVLTDIVGKITKSGAKRKWIEFNSTATLVPEYIAKERNATELKTSGEAPYKEWLSDRIASPESNLTYVSAPGNSLKTEGKRIQESKELSDSFNKILEETKGIKVDEQFSDITARTLGANKGKFRFFMSPAAEDFSGLLYDFMGKGKRGEEQQKFFGDNLLKPYMEGVTRIDRIKNGIKEGYRELKKEHPVEAKKINKTIEGTSNTYDQAVRVFLWDTNGVEIPGLSKSEIKDLVDVVKNDPGLTDFANKLSAASGQVEGWVPPSKYWNVESIVSDLHNVTEKGGRRQILGEFIENADAIFSPENLNKIEAARGTNFREALEDSLFRMKNGSNRSSSDKFAGQWASWVNNSSGAIMFLNTRSATLQLISSANFLNWRDNNPIKAAAAFANQPQYWKDFAELWNSPSLKERRSGLKSDVDQAEIANAVSGSKSKVKAALAYLLKIGYTPTQAADSFAICSGGSTFYRNRVNTYEKEGFTADEAKSKAYQDFLKTSEESQQSADPSKVSQQQASSIGRIILAFGNTPMQYNRLIKKSTRDLINGRGDARTNVSKILYYGAVQNLIFSSLQSALFAMAFDDEPEDEKAKKAAEVEKDKKYVRIANSMLDTVLRGTGVYGAVAATIKNTAIEYKKQLDKGWKGDQARTILAATSVSPPISSKLSKLYSATQTYKFEKSVVDKRGFDITIDGKLNPSPSYDIAGKVIASTTNFPLDRIVDKANNIAEILDERNATWQKLALGLGWKTFDVGVKNEEEDLIKSEAKATKEFNTAVATKEKNISDKQKLSARLKSMTPEEKQVYRDSIKTVKIKQAKKKKMVWEKVKENKNK